MQQTPTNVTDPTIDANTNRFNANQNYGYDKNGNLISDAESRVFTFNADNKQTKVVQNGQTVAEYFFDGEGKRVKKKVYDPNNQSVVTEEAIFVYSNGKLVAEYSTVPPPQNPTTSYTVTDQLGSPRVITNSVGDVVSRRDFMPFGEQLAPDGTYRTANLYSTGDNIRQKFTGYERDIESDLDFAQARMYNKNHGRFTSVDPIMMKKERMSDPQRINLYAYVRNNPLMFTDPKGMDLVLGEGDQKRLRKALIEIAKRPGGREFLQKLDKLTIQIVLQTGTLDGKTYERIGGKDTNSPTFVREKDDKGNISNVKGDTLSVKLDVGLLDKDKKENKKIQDANEANKALGLNLPEKNLIENVPPSDSHLIGHGLAHGENQLFGLTNTEGTADARINGIMQQPVDKNLSKDADKFVDNLLKPNQPVEQPQEEKKKKP